MATKFTNANATLTLNCSIETPRNVSPEVAASTLHNSEAALKAIGAAAKRAGINAVCTGRNEFKVDGAGVPAIMDALSHTIPTGRFDSRDGSPIMKPDAMAVNNERTRVIVDANDFLSATGINAQVQAISNGRPVGVSVSIPRR